MEETSQPKIPEVPTKEELTAIGEKVAAIDYAQANERRSEINALVGKLDHKDPEFTIFFNELYFEGMKFLEPEDVERYNFARVNEKGILVNRDNVPNLLATNHDISNRFPVYLAALKYFTELKQAAGSYEYGNIAPYGERLRTELNEILLTQEHERRKGREREEASKKEAQANIEAHRALMHREVPKAFREAGLPLNKKLSEMLMEPDEMQGGRTGSGYTNVFRELSTYVNNSLRNPLELFDEDAVYELLKDTSDRRLSREEKIQELGIGPKLEALSKKLNHPSHALLVTMLRDIVFRPEKNLPDVKIENDQNKLSKAGTCTTAEIYYFKWEGLDEFKKTDAGYYDGGMKVITDQNGTPMMIEKIGMGEKSCISLTPFKMGNVEIPVGSMLQAVPKEDAAEEDLPYRYFKKKATLDQYDGFRFLRLSTLSLPPELREETFGNHYQQQIENDYVNYDWVETRHYQELANRALAHEKYRKEQLTPSS